MRPIVGISAYREMTHWGSWRMPTALIPWSYVNAVHEAGGMPVLIPPVRPTDDAILQGMDGLILSGGPDLHSGQTREPHGTDGYTQPLRDDVELDLLNLALKLDLPVLGVCRGMQLLNVACGGDLVRHLPDGVGHDGHRQSLGAFSYHPVIVDGDSRLGATLSEPRLVASCHHQGIRSLGSDLVAVAWAADGTVEAIEHVNQAFVVGVLWHPEEDGDRSIFTAFVSACADGSARADRV